MLDWSQVCWTDVLGSDFCGMSSAELEELQQAVGAYARRSLRLRSAETATELPFETEVVPWFAAGRFLVDPQVRPGAFLEYAVGDYYIQDAASMLALALSGIRPGQRVCDACAAPGGKSTGALELLDGRGLLVANEVIQSRLAILEHALCRTGFGNHLITNLDIEQLVDFCADSFDCVLVDAPCSGQSMVARGKQSMAAFSMAQIEHSSARQRRILRAAAELTQPGGRLVYSTCTFAVAENEEVVCDFLDHHPDWTALEVDELKPWASPVLPGTYRLWPHRDGCSGGFAAALVRSGSASQTAQVSLNPTKLVRPIKLGWERIDTAMASWEWLRNSTILPEASEASGRPAAFVLARKKQELHVFAEGFPQSWIERAHAGVCLAESRGDRVEPMYGAAILASGEWQAARSVDLEDALAMRFVAGEAVRLEGSPAAGWSLVRWRGRPIAWGKIVGNTLKNHLPKLLRTNLK